MNQAAHVYLIFNYLKLTLSKVYIFESFDKDIIFFIQKDLTRFHG